MARTLPACRERERGIGVASGGDVDLEDQLGTVALGRFVNGLSAPPGDADQAIAARVGAQRVPRGPSASRTAAISASSSDPAPGRGALGS